MLFNAAYNSIHVVLTNIYRVLIDAADIYLHYIKSIFHLKEPAVKLLASECTTTTLAMGWCVQLNS